MPELPEVEAMRRLLERQAAGRCISRVSAREAGGGPRSGRFDDKVIGEGVGEEAFCRALLGRTVLAARRWGKQLWLELSGAGPHLLLHCGMTGAIVVDGIERFSFQSFSVDEAWPPRFTKLQLDLQARSELGKATSADPVRVAFADPRRFGKILLRERPRQEAPISELAPDPMVAPLSLEAFSSAVVRSSMPVKSLLLDQGKVVCGVGNWVADEVLHEARVHPAAPASSLSDGQLAALHAALQLVVREAADVDADSTRFPKRWLFHCRWGAGANGKEVELPGGGRAAFMEVGGRTTAFEPAVQCFGERGGAAKPRRAAPQPHQAASKKRPASAGAAARAVPARPTGAFGVPLRKRPATVVDLGR